MPLIHDTIPQFFNGVSQQAPNLRRESQVEDQVNCLSSIAEGITPRAHSEFLSLLEDGLLGEVAIHIINRSADERFVVVLGNESIRVFDLDGNEMTVTFPAGTDYLVSTNPKRDFRAYTVKDYTFIVNTTIDIDTVTSAAGTLTGTVQTFAKLSDIAGTAAVGAIYKIEGDDNSGFDSYYVEKTVENSSNAGDVWTETYDPLETEVGFDEATMPHQLVRTGLTTFEFQTITYEDRMCGDAITNPFPSFTGRTISDLFVYRNRFGFLSGDNVILSESGAANFFNFFRTTVTQLLDSDPIDVSANNTRVADLQYAVPFTDSLLLFSEQTQFEFGSDDLLTPKTVEIKPTTEFVTSVKARPVLAGRNIYFAVERTEFSGIREYFVDLDNRGNDAADVTKHVPRYIPANVFKIIPSSNEDMLFILTEDEPDAIYIYQWFWAQTSGGLDKLQSAWHKWKFTNNANILNGDLIDNQLIVVLEREGRTFIEKVDLTPRNNDEGLLFPVRLDRRVEVQGTYDALSGYTTWELPYSTDEELTIVRNGLWAINAGLEILTAEAVDGNTLRAFGDHTDDKCFIGVEFPKSFTLSPIYVRTNSSSGGSISRLGGRLQLRNIKFFYNDSSLFNVSVTPLSRDATERQFTPAISSNEAIIGEIVPQEGVFSVPVLSKADTTTITISSDSYLPFAITSAEWEGFYHSSAR